MPVIRGGFYDRFNNYYEDGINYNEYSSLNIIVKDVIKESLTIKMMNANKNTVKNA